MCTIIWGIKKMNDQNEQEKRWYQKPLFWIILLVGLLVSVGVGLFIYFQLGRSEIGLAQRVYDWASMQGSITPQTIKDCARVSNLDKTGIDQLKQMATGKEGSYAVHNLCRNTAVQRLHNVGIFPELKKRLPTIYIS